MRHVGRNVYDNMRARYGRLRKPHFSYFQTRHYDGKYGVFTREQRIAALLAQDALEEEVDKEFAQTVDDILEEQAKEARVVGAVPQFDDSPAKRFVDTGGPRVVTTTTPPSPAADPGVRQQVEQRKSESIIKRAGGVIRGALSRLGGFFRRKR